MCEPVTLFAVGAGLTAAGATKRAIDAGNQSATAAYLDELNAQDADLAASDARDRATSRAGVAAIQGGELKGEQTAHYAASGVSVTSGSALDVLSDTAALTALKEQIIKNDGAREAYGLKGKALNFRLQADAARKRGQAAQFDAILSGVSGIAQGAGGLMSVRGIDDTPAVNALGSSNTTGAFSVDQYREQGGVD